MCGICGIVDFAGRRPDEAVLRGMCQAVRHRGPDDEGLFLADGIALGQRRLAIIDLSRGATAPLANEDGSVQVVFNGEIYNFQELRTQLERRGHVFRTRTDTEVLVHLYEEDGPALVHRLRGMFAFALWDARRQRLIAARDRFGKKPFYYALAGGRLVFGSELPALLRHPDVPVAPDYAALDAYLTLQYVPSPLSAFAGVRKLPAAHLLQCSAAGELRVERYWSPPAPEPLGIAAEELESELLRRLEEAVRIRLVADVPLGAFLSGGVDSGTVVALMARASSRPVTTFSVGTEDEASSELPYARQVAQRYGTEHHEVMVRVQAAEVLPLLVRHYGEPFADSSALPSYYISQVARRFVTVALSGDGGDESFSGYERYGQVVRWSRADRVPAWARSSAQAAGTALLRRLGGNRAARLERGLTMLAGTLPQRYALQMTVVKPQEKAALYSERFRALAGGAAGESGPGWAGVPADAAEWREDQDAHAWMMRQDQSAYLPDCLMVKMDIASMANGLEVRAPLLDTELAAFAAAIPSPLKRDAQGGKRILKRAVASLLPRDVLTKPKTGFGVPLGRWLREPALASLTRGALLDDRARARGLFRPEGVRRMLDEHLRGERDWSYRLWALLWLELWFREFID